jgi:hypothetical protein
MVISVLVFPVPVGPACKPFAKAAKARRAEAHRHASALLRMTGSA